MKQLELYPSPLREINVDGMVDDNGIQFVGMATQQLDGSWRCLADVGGALCIVKVYLTF
jgi:hypothetical protein